MQNRHVTCIEFSIISDTISIGISLALTPKTRPSSKNEAFCLESKLAIGILAKRLRITQEFVSRGIVNTCEVTCELSIGTSFSTNAVEWHPYLRCGAAELMPQNVPNQQPLRCFDYDAFRLVPQFWGVLSNLRWGLPPMVAIH